jgi:hypothetical protein
VLEFVFCFQLGNLVPFIECHDMPRRLRIEFDGAIYHVMARGNARRMIVRDDVDRRRQIDALERTAVRRGWELSN